MKMAMVAWAEWHEAQGGPPVRLLAQIHDELILESDAPQVPPQDLAQVRWTSAARLGLWDCWGEGLLTDC